VKIGGRCIKETPDWPGIRVEQVTRNRARHVLFWRMRRTQKVLKTLDLLESNTRDLRTTDVSNKQRSLRNNPTRKFMFIYGLEFYQQKKDLLCQKVSPFCDTSTLLLRFGFYRHSRAVASKLGELARTMQHRWPVGASMTHHV
jgi:hypothetical protein